MMNGQRKVMIYGRSMQFREGPPSGAEGGRGAMREIKTTQCEYHCGMPIECALVQLRPLPSAAWQPSLWCCEACRNYLKGLWRYARKDAA